MIDLCGGRLKVGNEILSLVLLLDTSENHLGSRNVLLRSQKVLEESILVPGDSLLHVGIGISVSLSLTSLAAKESVKVRSLLVGLTSSTHVALSTLSLENLSTLSNVTHFDYIFGLFSELKVIISTILTRRIFAIKCDCCPGASFRG